MNTAKTVEKTVPKFSIGEIVDINTWAGIKYGFEIEDVHATYHMRFGEYVWGYKLHKDGERTGFSFEYVPEGYLRKREHRYD